jgi:hypothetical protein
MNIRSTGGTGAIMEGQAEWTARIMKGPEIDCSEVMKIY